MPTENTNIETVEITPEQVVETPAAPDTENTTNIQSVEITGTEQVVETPEAPVEYDWETDMTTRVSAMETAMKSLAEQNESLRAQLATLMDERDKRNKKLSGFFKPMEQAPKDENTITYDDLYTIRRK